MSTSKNSDILGRVKLLMNYDPRISLNENLLMSEQETPIYFYVKNNKGGYTLKSGNSNQATGYNKASRLFPNLNPATYPRELDSAFKPISSQTLTSPSVPSAPSVTDWKGKEAPKEPVVLPKDYSFIGAPNQKQPKKPWVLYNGELMNATDAEKQHSNDLKSWVVANYGYPPTEPIQIRQDEGLKNRVNNYVDYHDYLIDLRQNPNDPRLKAIGNYMKQLHEYNMKTNSAYAVNYNLRTELESRKKLAGAEIDQYRKPTLGDLNPYSYKNDVVLPDATATRNLQQQMKIKMEMDILNKYKIPELEKLVDTQEKREFLQEKENINNLWTLASIGTAIFAPMFLGLSQSSAFAFGAALDATEAYKYYLEKDWNNFGQEIMFALMGSAPEALELIQASPTMLYKLRLYSVKIQDALSKGIDLTLPQDVADELKRIAQNTTEIIKKAPQIRQAVIDKVPNSLKAPLKALTSEPAQMFGAMYLASEKYEDIYKKYQKATPKATAESLGYNWENLKRDFVSSGSEEDNLKLKQALLNKWKPGDPVPPEFQTELYKEVIGKKQKEVEILDKEKKEYVQQYSQQTEKKVEFLNQNIENIKNNKVEKEVVTSYYDVVFNSDVDTSKVEISKNDSASRVNSWKIFIENRKKQKKNAKE
jgi:hypothetical protein